MFGSSYQKRYSCGLINDPGHHPQTPQDEDDRKLAMEALGNIAPEEGSGGGAVGRRRYHEGDRKAAAAAEVAAAAAVSKSESVYHVILLKCFSIILLVHYLMLLFAGKPAEASSVPCVSVFFFSCLNTRVSQLRRVSVCKSFCCVAVLLRCLYA